MASPRKRMGQHTATGRRRFIFSLIASAIFALTCRGFLAFHKVATHDGLSFTDDIVHRPPLIPLRSSYQLNKLPKVHVPHGTFHFAPHSHSLRIPENETIEHSWTPQQARILDDEEIDIEKEKQRCASYNFDFPDPDENTPIKRRRIFMGGLIATDSLEVLRAVGTEAHGIYHSVSYIESDVAPAYLVPRKWTYLDENNSTSQSLRQLYQFFGNQTRVSVDYYITNRTEKPHDTVIHEALQKEGINERWKMNGMRPDDIAIIADADETFTRDFLRALQICDVPAFRRNQDCHMPNYFGSTMVLESSSECITKQRRWYHPDAMLGECVDRIGNETLHPPTERNWKPNGFTSYHGDRARGYGRDDKFEEYRKSHKHDEYPLWTASDIRVGHGGRMIRKKDKSPAGYHFHNFFTSAQEIHTKYSTYTHADKTAVKKPVWEIHADLDLAVRCAKAKTSPDIVTTDVDSFTDIQGSERPIYYLNKGLRKRRHHAWQSIVSQEEEKYKSYLHNNSDAKVDENKQDKVDPSDTAKSTNRPLTQGATPDWDSSKSVVMGLGSGYPIGVYHQFVGSLRATGFSGHIILGISMDADERKVEYLQSQNVTMHQIEKASVCTYNGTIGHEGKVINTETSREWNCPKAYPDYKITWARFLMYRDWLKDCPSCTDGVVLTDVRDALFQRDPFKNAVQMEQQHPLMVFEESPLTDTRHWLTDFPLKSCRKYTFGRKPMLCSGSVMGSREGILDYIDVMEEEFIHWKTREECRFDMRGDDQSIHNYLFYSGKLKNATSIKHRTGPIHVVGYEAARISENATKAAKEQNATLTGDFYVRGNKWQQWLPANLGLISSETGLITNLDGSPSAQVHQVDRFGSLYRHWLGRIIKEGWPYHNQRNKPSSKG